MLSNSEKFPEVVSAVENLETTNFKCRWALADALKKECGSEENIEQAAKRIAELGYEDYKSTTLYHLRALAVAFPPDRRQHNLGWAIYYDIRNADLMDKYVAACEANNIKMSLRSARDFVERLQEQNPSRQAWEKEHAREVNRLQADIDAAAERERQASNTAEREEAAKRLDEAKRAHNTQFIKRPPHTPRSELVKVVPQDTGALRTMAAVSSAIGKMGQAELLMKEVEKDLEPYYGKLDTVFVNSLVEHALDVQNKSVEVANKIRADQTNKRSHLNVVAN
jgi:hypothetical protein